MGRGRGRIDYKAKEFIMRVARVFPRRTAMTPTGEDVYVGLPELFMPKYDEVHISVAFTWDLERAYKLAHEWKPYTVTVRVDGPACGLRGEDFKAGVFLKKGVAITSRGCPNNCSFCFVPKREGKIRELPIVEGNIIQDNNLLACSKEHLRRVFAMLKTQKHIDFSGGLEASRITNKIAKQLRELSIYQIWLAYDSPNAEKPLKKAVQILNRYFYREVIENGKKIKIPLRDKIRCYVLIGYKGDTLEKAENRLRRAWEIGTLPFAMKYRPLNQQWDDTYLFKERDWNLLARQWTRPAIMKTIMRGKVDKL